MTLPYDIARCSGNNSKECEGCRRREPGHSYRQCYISPPDFIDGKCVNKIELESEK